MTPHEETKAVAAVARYLRRKGWQNIGPKRWVNPDGFTIDLDAVTWQTGEARAMWAVIYEEMSESDTE